MIDESLPGEHPAWNDIEKKLVADDPLVVVFAFTPDGYAQHARFALPAPVFPEAAGDLAQSIDSTAPTFRLVAPLIGAPAGTVNARGVRREARGLRRIECASRARRCVHAAGKGSLARTLHSAQTAQRGRILEGTEQRRSLGGRGTGRRPRARRNSSAAAPVEAAALTAFAAERAFTDSPLLTKLYRESNLLLGPGRIAMHPNDAQARGLDAGAQGAARSGLRIAIGGSDARPEFAAGNRADCRHRRFCKGGAHMKRYGMAIDIDRCNGCGACMVACAVGEQRASGARRRQRSQGHHLDPRFPGG